ncbi:MBL fold metallo-hydrolase [Microbacterium gorillae]|uniref:MBL fold metallo-hydrolase n=1 Tax=Microbacterium gorillae TaxID=1231063 RepID=UPI001141EB19|nr:MBL fold metallo-hydrolase [Microbacterium gorillae]
MATESYAVCDNCGTQFGEASPVDCPICWDVRNQMRRGQPRGWTTVEQLGADHRNVFRDDAGFTGIGTEPAFGLEQRAVLVPFGESNLLWDCVTLIDDETVAEIERRGGLSAIAISHPHYYASMVQWAERFDVPVYLHEDDRAWAMRDDSRIVFWSGETLSLSDDLTLVRVGGQFAGSQILHVASRDAVLVGDSVLTTLDPDWVGFSYASGEIPGGGWTQLLPLDEVATKQLHDAFAALDFDLVVGSWWEHNLPTNGKDIILRSAVRSILAVRGDVSARTMPPVGGYAPLEERPTLETSPFREAERV